MKLNVKAVALASGLTWSLGVLFLGLISMGGWAKLWVGLISSAYLGYSSTIIGAIIGAIWGFVDGVIGGAIFAWLYNKFAK